MKIGIVCYPTFGGSGIVATELGKALADKGHEVHFVAYRQPVRLNDQVNNIVFHEVRVADYPLFEYPPYELSLACKLLDVVKYEKLDLLHVHYAIPHAYVAYLTKQMLAEEGIHIPVVTTLHGTDITLVGKSPALIPAVNFSINHSNVVTAVSKHLREETLNCFSIRKEIKVIPNFIDFDLHNYTFDKDLHMNYAPNREKIMIHISNFRPVKRVADVIRVFVNVRDKMPVKLLMVGDGPQREVAEYLCRDMGCSDDVKFLGKTQDVSRLLAISDLFVLPSEKESFGLVALEAMAAGIPVVSSNTGGLAHVNINGVTGYTSEVGDVAKMSNDAISLLSDKGKYNDFAQNALSVAKEYDICKILPLYEAVYREALETIK
ncbi:MAG: N-acetyl-alpha-D-glucosaminyl L-malate synthase BshA [Bacteroidetes bacterium MED-G21]|nr:MAG: N-acetyl-alpha-D-glucosaminyl L-malate synthase BshA [Bacteroidetes bacterium MED-G21]